jgi:glycosyltransferase involved in cell wall biosynthesis
LEILGAADMSFAGRSVTAEAGRLNVSSRITLPGVLDGTQVADHLLRSDVFLLPSRADNSPNALCEAMALGMPCVASTAGGIPSLATDGEDALLVPPGDPYSLAGAIRALLIDRELAGRLARAARVRSLARHDPDAVASQLATAYRQIAEARGGRSGPAE